MFYHLVNILAVVSIKLGEQMSATLNSNELCNQAAH